jgi:flagellar biosynthesis/type III secretory pathway protein FliH
VRAKQAKESYVEGFFLGHKIGYEAPKEEIEQAYRTHTAIDMLNHHRERAAIAYANEHASKIRNGEDGK